MFSGHDCTVNLSVMSLESGTLDSSDYTLDDDGLLALAEWILYFDERYGAPVGMISVAELPHPVTIGQLPRPKKMPFSKSRKGSKL